MLHSQFGFSNNEALTKTVSPVNIGIVSNYNPTQDEPTDVRLVNKTTPVDQDEQISYRCAKLNNVNLDIDVPNREDGKQYVQYVIRLDEVLRTTDDKDPTFVVDEPVYMALTVRHTKSSHFTNDKIASLLSRLIGAAMYADGTYRFEDLMRGALRPAKD